MVKITDYFRSGWAFLVPYVLIYLVYAGLKWPVNQSSGAIPSLYAVYWSLHAIHIALGLFTFFRLWRNRDTNRSVVDVLFRVLPWFCLALVFLIPGVYMEFPADPWQHFARVNEWRWHDLVVQHSEWKKSSYFLGYSLIGHIAPPLLQLKTFNLYYTACCLLLCWQYYRLARSMGFSPRGGLFFILLHLLLSGNNVFGFYRYYGMSSTVFAQIGAVAITRIAIEIAVNPRFSMRSFFGFNASKPPLPERNMTNSPLCAWNTGLAGLALTTLIAFNHPQGLGIAALGISAVAAWRLIRWKRSVIIWITALAVVASVAAILWYPRHPFIDSIYRPRGWLTPWLGFNFYQPSSPAFQRAFAITGVFGGVNILAGCWLIYRNQLAGWLTLMPMLLLSLPFVAIPFCNLLGPNESFPEGYIIVFHRMLFAIPTGLALAFVFDCNINKKPDPLTHIKSFACVLTALVLFVLTPAVGPWSFNRLYNIISKPPGDLAMLPLVEAMPRFFENSPRFTSAQGVSYIATAVGSRAEWYSQKWMPRGRSETVKWSIIELQQTAAKGRPALFMIPNQFDLVSSNSLTGFLSQHWNPHQVAIEYLRGPQIDYLLKSIPAERFNTRGKSTFFLAPPQN